MNNLNNVSLWFAKNDNGEIERIDKINNNYNGKYYCPLCGSEIIPKAINSKCVSAHFAHIDRDNCSGESFVHWWVKNELIKKDDVIEVITDKSKQVMCKEILIENSYQTPYGVYRPDITIIAYNCELIFVEINYNNKKNTKDYYLKWSYLGNTVVQVNINDIYKEDNKGILFSNSFKAIYYKGISADLNKESGRYKKFKNSFDDLDTSEIKELSWFIDDIYRYNIGLIDSSQIEMDLSCINEFMSERYKRKVCDIYKKSNCNKAIIEAIKYRNNSIDATLKEWECLEFYHVHGTLYNHYIYDKIFDSTKMFIRIPKYIANYFKQISVSCPQEINLSIKGCGDIDRLRSILINIDHTMKNLKSEHRKIMMIRIFCNDVFNNGLTNTNVYYSIGEYMELEIKNSLWERYNVKMCFISNKIFFEDREITGFNKEVLAYDLKSFLALLKVLIDLRKTYSYVNKLYKVNINNKTFTLENRKEKNIISEFYYNNDTTYRDVVNKFSCDIRQYLYGRKDV